MCHISGKAIQPGVDDMSFAGQTLVFMFNEEMASKVHPFTIRDRRNVPLKRVSACQHNIVSQDCGCSQPITHVADRFASACTSNVSATSDALLC